MIKLKIQPKIWPLKGTFRISRSALSEIETIWVSIDDGIHIGRGECRPYARYGDSVDSVTRQIEAQRNQIENGLSLEDLQNALPPGPARNAVDCAMWDLRAKQSGQSVSELLGIAAPQPHKTAFTLSIDTPENMAAAAKMAADYPVLKLKIGEDAPIDCIKAVTKTRPGAELIIDANEALNLSQLAEFDAALKNDNIALIEQPIHAGEEIEGCFSRLSLPYCADESLHRAADLPRLKAAGYRAVNVKLDKCGGVTEALTLIQAAKAEGFLVMAGCMVASSLAMAPMVTLESLADYIDLDGPILLARDCEAGLKFEGATIHPPTSKLWG